jgi:hypothetical protein
MAKYYEQPEMEMILEDNSDIYITEVPDDIMQSFAQAMFPTIEEYFNRTKATE